jgi:hypothetical protein
MDAIWELLKMLGIGVILVYLIMVAQFQSLRSPFIVMFTIPLAFTGGFLGLFITGFDVSVVALIGFVMLCGVVVNNGIVLVDYINQLRIEGMEKKEALIEAGKTRMRPILMTAITTIIGLFSMALGIGEGFMDNMAGVNKDIEKSIAPLTHMSVSGTISGPSALSTSASGLKPINAGSTSIEALAKALNNNNKKIILQVDKRTLGQITVEGINDITKLTGSIPLQFA